MGTTSSKDTYVFPVVKNGKFTELTLDEMRAVLALAEEEQKQTNTTKPVEEKKPDTVVIGTSAITGGVMELGTFDGLPFGLAEIISRKPLAYRYRGANYPIKFTGGYSVKDLAGIGVTAFDGKEQPLHDRPKGFFRRLFPDAKSKGDFYYEKGDKPDEVFKEPTPAPAPTPAPVQSNPPAVPDTNVVAGDHSTEQNIDFFKQ